MANKDKKKDNAEALTRQRDEARQRERDSEPAGTVQFRMDAEMMTLLTKVANHKRTPAGVLARMWVVERLHEEAEKLRSRDK